MRKKSTPLMSAGPNHRQQKKNDKEGGNYSLPVFRYHHVNNHEKDPRTITPKAFEEQISYLALKEYRTLTMAQALACLKGEQPLTGKELLLTFDDGFLDNWVYAYPILHKYGMKGVIFLATAFVEQGEEECRPHYGLVTRRMISEKELPPIHRHKEFNYRAIVEEKNYGLYLRWPELIEMEASGAFDVQAHGHFHGKYFCDSPLEGFSRKASPSTAMATGGDTRPGIPVHATKPALTTRRYYDDMRLRDRLAAYVTKRGAGSFFERPRQEWQAELAREREDFIQQEGLQDTWETKEEFTARIKDDLLRCKVLIENKLGKKCLAIAWPWGKYDERLVRQARETGYEAAFSNRRGPNPPGADLFHLNRCAIKKGGIRWFARQLFIYSRPKVSYTYLKLQRRR